jgi:hypothetical protein
MTAGVVARAVHHRTFTAINQQLWRSRNMLRLMFGVVVGFVAGYLYGSERAREEARRRLASAPEPVRQVTERMSGAIAGAPVPDALKNTATRATAAIQTVTERAAQAAGPAPEILKPTPNEVAGRPAEPLPRNEP